MVAWVDEFAGVAFLCVPELKNVFAGDYARTTLWVFTVPQVLAGIVEPPLMVWAAAQPRARKLWVAGGLSVMGAAYLALACVSHPGWFAAWSALAFVGSGIGVNLAQASLVDAAPGRRAPLMVRWTLLGALGDLATPCLLAVFAWASLSYRYGFAVAGGLTIALAVLLLTQRFPGAVVADDAPALQHQPWLVVRHAPVLGWLLLASLCSLLDEVFFAFAALHMAEVWQLPPSQRSALLTLVALASAVGLFIAERALARGASARAWLLGSSATTAFALLTWVLAPAGWVSALALVCVGAAAAPLWPLVKAQAFAALPQQAAAVEAASSVLGWVELLFPVLLGWAADQVGIEMALLLLMIQPLAVLWSALRMAVVPG